MDDSDYWAGDSYLQARAVIIMPALDRVARGTGSIQRSFFEFAIKRCIQFARKSSVYFNRRIADECRCSGIHCAALSAVDKFWLFVIWTLVTFTNARNTMIFSGSLAFVLMVLLMGPLFFVHSIFVAEGG